MKLQKFHEVRSIYRICIWVKITFWVIGSQQGPQRIILEILLNPHGLLGCSRAQLVKHSSLCTVGFLSSMTHIYNRCLAWRPDSPHVQSNDAQCLGLWHNLRTKGTMSVSLLWTRRDGDKWYRMDQLLCWRKRINKEGRWMACVHRKRGKEKENKRKQETTTKSETK
jgi:hypothetical protein